MLNFTNFNQDFIKVNVEYYDENEKQKLSSYPTLQNMNKLVKNGIDIPTSEFLTYYLFYRKRPGKKGWKKYSDLERKINVVIGDLEDFITFNGKSINIPKNVKKQVLHITEHIGESIGLSVVNRICDLTEADWDKIPEISVKTFDYKIASDGKNIIQIETKGSSVDNNIQKSSSIYDHKLNIKTKKSDIAKLESRLNYKYPANYRYGTITAIDYRKNGIAKCWILDPDSNQFEINPLILRLINRQKFLRDWISFIWPRSQISPALSTRIIALKSLKNPFELNNKPLLRANNKEFEFTNFYNIDGISPWFVLKSHVTDGPAGGIVIQLSHKALFFFGIREDLLKLAAQQNFENIINYKAECGSIIKRVKCKVSKGRFRDFVLPENVETFETDEYYHFILEGKLHYSPGGVVFGILPLKF